MPRRRLTTIIKPTVTLIIDARENQQSVSKTIHDSAKNWQDGLEQIILIGELPNINFTELYPKIARQTVATKADFFQLLKSLETNLICYVPPGTNPNKHLPEITSISSNFLAPFPPNASLPEETAKEMPLNAVPWLASTNLIKLALPQLQTSDNWTVLEIANTLEKLGLQFQWGAVCASEANIPALQNYSKIPLNINSKVLALIPHYGCETWLNQCLKSLLNQTRPLDGIVVIDDASPQPPVSIVEEFPNVTLLRSPLNVGPYRLIQQVIEDTDYDAYLFQDADDWSARERLEKLLYTAQETGAELLGTQEFRILEEQSLLIPVCYPLNVNQALAEKPGHPLLHPTSIVTRDLVMRLGGFATKLRFGGDTEFLLRAALAAKIANLPYYCYFRRKREGSLTTAPKTGLNSLARNELLSKLKHRALANYAALREGKQLCLSPLEKDLPIQLSHVTGPKL